MKFDCLILGGGAAGLMAGVALARGGASVAIVERQSRVGRKLLSTGNGRCNFTNRTAAPEDYFGDLALARGALSAFPPEKILRIFEELGVPARVDAEGRAYPLSNQASSVLDALRLAFAEGGGVEIPDFEVLAVHKKGDLLSVRASDDREILAPYVLAATGGLAGKSLGARDCPFLAMAGHSFTRRSPALSPLKTQPFPALKGVRAFVQLSMDGHRESGEILFTEYGVSGIAAMQLARFVHPGSTLQIDFFPEGDGAQFLCRRARLLPKRRMEDFLNGIVPKRVGQVLCKAAGLAPTLEAGALSEAELRRLGDLLNAFPVPVLGARGYENAQVTAGGLTGFDPDTLESRAIPGLFAAGELLDVDGPCGGYNLQWAWASALLAARSILQKRKGGIPSA